MDFKHFIRVSNFSLKITSYLFWSYKKIHRLNFRKVEYIQGVERTWGQNFPKRAYFFSFNITRPNSMKKQLCTCCQKIWKNISEGDGSLNCRFETCHTTKSWTLSMVFFQIFLLQMQSKFINGYITAFSEQQNTYFCRAPLCEYYYIVERVY